MSKPKLPMLAIWAVLTIILLGCLPGARITGSGRMESRDYPVGSFDSVDIDSAFRAEVRQANTHSVTVIADDNLFRYISVRNSRGKLNISLRSGFLTGFSSGTLRVVITMPYLDSVEVSGASQCDISGFRSGGDLRVTASGASRLEGDLIASDLTLDVSGASAVRLRGAADTVRLEGSGTSSLDLSTFEVDDADVDLSGGSTAIVNVKEELSYDLSGGSRLEYWGDPDIGRARTSGGASATQR